MWVRTAQLGIRARFTSIAVDHGSVRTCGSSQAPPRWAAKHCPSAPARAAADTLRLQHNARRETSRQPALEAVRYHAAHRASAHLRVGRSCSISAPARSGGARTQVKTSALARGTRGWQGQLTWQLQTLRSSFPGTVVYCTCGSPASQEHQEVRLGPPVAAMDSRRSRRGALTTTRPGAGVTAIRAGIRFVEVSLTAKKFIKPQARETVCFSCDSWVGIYLFGVWRASQPTLSLTFHKQ